MSLAFLCKKSWHTSNLKNVEQVWIAEQKAAAEEKKLSELRKQIEEERQVQELRELQAKTNIGGSKAIRKVDFLYEGPMAAQSTTTEEYLMGKSFKDPGEVNEVQELENKQKAGSLFLNKAANTANEQFRRIHDDPMLEIRRKQKAAKEHILKNPVKMGKIRKVLEDKKLQKMLKKERKAEKKAKKKAKKHKKKRGNDKEDNSDSDSQHNSNQRNIDNRPAWMTKSSRKDQDKKKSRSRSRSPIRPREKDTDFSRRNRSRSPPSRKRERKYSRSSSRSSSPNDRRRRRQNSRSRSRSLSRKRRRRSGRSRSRSDSPNARRRRSGRSTSPRSLQPENPQDNTFVKKKGYGLQGGKVSSGETGLDEVMFRKRKELIEAEKRETAAKLAGKTRKPMTEAERLKKLAEFSSDASTNDDLRQKRLRKEHMKEKLEEKLNEARRDQTMQMSKESGGKTPAFLKKMEGEALGAGGSQSMADRVKRNRHYQQRGHDSSTGFNNRD